MCGCKPFPHIYQRGIVFCHNDEIGMALNLHPVFYGDPLVTPIASIVNEGPIEWDGFKKA